MKITPRPIVIDPGHGGKDSGALGPNGAMEKTIALAVSKLTARLLNQNGVPALLARSDDSYLSLSQRASFANSQGAHLLSIHCNAGGGHGYEAFTSPGQTISDPWATHLLDSFGETFPDHRLRADFSDGDPDKEARFTVLTKTKLAAVLFELGFIDNPKGESFLSDPNNHWKFANALTAGTLKWLGLKHTAHYTGEGSPGVYMIRPVNAPPNQPLPEPTRADILAAVLNLRDELDDWISQGDDFRTRLARLLPPPPSS